MDPPVDGIPVRHVLRSVHFAPLPPYPGPPSLQGKSCRHRVQLALRFGRLDQHQRSKAHLPTSAPFRAQPPGLVSGQLSLGIRRRSRTTTRVSCRLSATGIRFLGILFPPGDSAPLTVGLPGSAWTPTGFPRSAHPSHGRIGCPLYPGAQRCSHDRSDPSGRRSPPLPGARPYHPGFIPSPGAVYYEASSRVHSRSPARPSPSPVGPWMEQGPLGLHPGLRTPAGRTCGARQGRGQASSTHPELHTPGITGPPPASSLAMCDLVSHDRPGHTASW